ncbi:MAG: hypothetical protein OEX97_07375 [Acidimicrobiia bacterium]|nr:hypothetical protein [Acidimicrobiia bacterium]
MTFAVFLISLVYLALRKIGSIGDSDMWWHLRTGDLIRDTGSVPVVDPFSWTASGEAWQPNAWLSDVMFSWLREVGGLAALSVYRSVGVILIGSLLWWALRRRGSSEWAAIAAVLFGVLLMMPFITERPQVIGFVLFAALMHLLPKTLEASWPALAGTGVLLALWANLHGSFIMGIGVIGLSATGYLIRQRELHTPLLVVLVGVTTPLLNPYGLNVYRQALSIPTVSSFIDEWRPFDLTDVRDQLIALFILIAFLGMWRGDRWKQWDVSIPMIALILLTTGAIRTAPFLLMWGAPFFAMALSSLAIPRLRSWAAPRAGPMGTGLVIAGLVLAGSMVPNISEAGSIDLERVPIKEVDVLPSACRLLNEYEFGGVVIDRRWPDLLVSQDGRNDLYGLDRIEQQESWFTDGDLAIIEQEGMTCVLARPTRPLATALRASPSWTTVSESHVAVTFIKSES